MAFVKRELPNMMGKYDEENAYKALDDLSAKFKAEKGIKPPRRRAKASKATDDE